MQSEHPDDMTMTYLAFPQLGVEVSPEWKLHVLSCRECMETILTLREMEDAGVLGVSQFKNDAPQPSVQKCCAEYGAGSTMKTAAAAAVGVGLIPAYEPLSLDDVGDFANADETDVDIDAPLDDGLSAIASPDSDIDVNSLSNLDLGADASGEAPDSVQDFMKMVSEFSESLI